MLITALLKIIIGKIALLTKSAVNTPWCIIENSQTFSTIRHQRTHCYNQDNIIQQRKSVGNKNF